jgi:hypothetical protein
VDELVLLADFFSESGAAPENQLLQTTPEPLVDAGREGSKS